MEKIFFGKFQNLRQHFSATFSATRSAPGHPGSHPSFFVYMFSEWVRVGGLGFGGFGLGRVRVAEGVGPEG